MANKTFSDKYLTFALKKKVFNRYEYKKNVDFSQSVAKALANTLSKEPIEELGRLGVLQKAQVFENGKTVKKLVFVANPTIQKKISSRYKNKIKKSVNARLKLRSIVILSVFIVCLIFAGFGIYKFFGSHIVLSYKNAVVKSRLEKDRRNKEKKREYYEQLALERTRKLEEQRQRELEKQREIEAKKRAELIAQAEEEERARLAMLQSTTTTTTTIITKEDIDFSQKNIYFTKEKDLFVKVGEQIDTNLQEGEVKQELVEYNGRIYNKITYIIIKDDTLWDISFRFLDNAYRWPFIHNLNKYIIDPDFILPGDPLVIYTEVKHSRQDKNDVTSD